MYQYKYLSLLSGNYFDNHLGQNVCNACGCYYKLHGVNRPSHLFREAPMTRRRNPKKKKDTEGASNHNSDQMLNGTLFEYLMFSFRFI